MRIITIAKIKYSLKLARTNKIKVKSVWLRVMEKVQGANPACTTWTIIITPIDLTWCQNNGLDMELG